MNRQVVTDSKIYSITAREILDSRANPTVETQVILNSGYRAIASVPAGASLGKYEAVELRDKDPKRFGGMGVLQAVRNVNGPIASKLRGMDARDQHTIDQTMVTLDGTTDKHALGANSILSVSLAVAGAAAACAKIPLYTYLNAIFQNYYKTGINTIPTPTFNVINGGKHGTGNLDFQEFHVVPATAKPFSEALRIGAEIYHSVKKILIYRNAVHSVGDEGGFAPDLFTNTDALEMIVEAIRATPYRFGTDVFLGLDVAASHFKKEKGYQIKDRPASFSGKEFIEYFKKMHEDHRLLLLEDPLNEDDWDDWKSLTEELGKDILIIGDDLLATNLMRLQKAIDEKACSAILLKPNQIGTLSEFFQVTALAKKHEIKCIVSHRSGETNDSFIADLAVAIQSEYVKFGAPARGERVAKYNRLLQIEAELNLN
ncbi:phosphopyruvate hydratase [Patescibacteria group bacterium]|nr:phosphopyruvate hydratase [Patescibacteria group bacterium]MBU1473223.1 phosphopyruvate hydratase [Patescibacteria group bacterium]MBU2459919.1 phosphopyruvate hydratase [Patescibacteria group bacterium]MBU2544138.1 phosphopyruvate hydratase [Patescibacteria group bacterium]